MISQRYINNRYVVGNAISENCPRHPWEMSPSNGVHMGPTSVCEWCWHEFHASLKCFVKSCSWFRPTCGLLFFTHIWKLRHLKKKNTERMHEKPHVISCNWKTSLYFVNSIRISYAIVNYATLFSTTYKIIEFNIFLLVFYSYNMIFIWRFIVWVL